MFGYDDVELTRLMLAALERRPHVAMSVLSYAEQNQDVTDVAIHTVTLSPQAARVEGALLIPLNDGIESASVGPYIVDGGKKRAKHLMALRLLGLALGHDFLPGGLRQPGREQVATGDAKSALNQLCQARKLRLPRYQLVSRQGPSHRPQFTVRCELFLDLARTQAREAEANAGSRKAAEQGAAKLVLEALIEDGVL